MNGTDGTDGPKASLPAAQELLPCAACGNKKVKHSRRRGITGVACLVRYFREQVYCVKCKRNTGTFTRPGLAFPYWNRMNAPQVAQRAGSEAAVAPDVRELLEGLRRTLSPDFAPDKPFIRAIDEVLAKPIAPDEANST